MKTRSLLFLTVLTSLSFVQAQEHTPAKAAAAAAPAPAASSEVKIKESGAPAPVIKGEKDAAGRDTLSVDFADEDIRTILRNTADLFELNIVIPESLQGKTSVKLRDVSWRQIFQIVLSPVNYSYVEEGNIIKVISNESLQQEPATTEVFILNYARAADIQATVASLVDAGAGGKIVMDARSNALVITERPSKLVRIRPIIESLDRATDQVMIESKFIEVTDRDVRNLGMKWNALSGYEVGASPGGENGRFGSYSRTQGQGKNNENNGNGSNSSSSSSSSGNSSTGDSSSNSSVSSNNGSVTGTSTTTSGSTLSSNASSAVSSASESVLNSLQSLTSAAATDRTLSAVFTASEFKVMLSALNSLNDTKIVSNPTVVTLNNSEATINVGEEYPIPNYTYNQERGTFEVSGFNYRPIGIILKVTPQVNARGFIKLTLEPEVSQKNGTTSFGGSSGATIPIIATRKAKTQVSLKDGFTMGIGGLIRKEATDGVTKVPVLGDIPVLGYLFKHKSKDSTTSNLLIFITAKIVSAEGATTEQVFSPDQIREMKLSERDLPGYREEKSALIKSTDSDPKASPSKKSTNAK